MAPWVCQGSAQAACGGLAPKTSTDGRDRQRMMQNRHSAHAGEFDVVSADCSDVAFQDALGRRAVAEGSLRDRFVDPSSKRVAGTSTHRGRLEGPVRERHSFTLLTETCDRLLASEGRSRLLARLEDRDCFLKHDPRSV